MTHGNLFLKGCVFLVSSESYSIHPLISIVVVFRALASGMEEVKDPLIIMSHPLKKDVLSWKLVEKLALKR